jgi:large subunit ribosomal protein L20
MTRVKRGNVARKRRKKILKLAKGFRGSHSRLFRTANQQVMKALRNAYRDRRKRKRDFVVFGLPASMRLPVSTV